MIAVAAIMIATAIVANYIPKYQRVRHANYINGLRQQVQHWEKIRSGAWHPLTEEEGRVFRMDDAAFYLHIGNYYDVHGEHTAANTARQHACFLAKSNSVSDLEEQCNKGGMWDVQDNDTVTHYFDEEEAAAAQQRVAIKTGHHTVGETVEFSTQKVLTNQ